VHFDEYPTSSQSPTAHKILGRVEFTGRYRNTPNPNPNPNPIGSYTVYM